MVKNGDAPTRQRCWSHTLPSPAVSTTTGQIPVVATSPFHENMEVSNWPKQPEVQGIKRYSTALRLPTLSHLTYPSARHALSYRQDPICVLQVEWTPALCSRDCAVSITQYSGEKSSEGEVGMFGEFSIYNPSLSALLECCMTQSSRHSQLLQEQALNLFLCSPWKSPVQKQLWRYATYTNHM